MSEVSVARRLLCTAAVVLLLALAWWTIAGGLRNLTHTSSLGQWVETAIQLGCGLLGVALVVTRFWGRHLAKPVRFAWFITLAAWVGLSALVWGPPQLHIALLFATVALLVAWVLVWALGPAPGRGLGR